MTLDGFLGFLALFLAFYAIVPTVTRLRAQLHLVIQIAFAALALVLVFYLEFYSVLKQPCWLPVAQICELLVFPADESFTPQQAAFLVVFFWGVVALSLNSLLKPGASALYAMRKIIETLLYERKPAELLDFVRPHLRLIEHAARRELPLQRAHDWVADVKWLRRQRIRAVRPALEPAVEGPQPGFPARMGEWVRRRMTWAARLIPSGRKAEQHADAIVRSMLRSEDFRRFLVTMRPDALPNLMAMQLQPRFDFVDKVLRDLIADSGSELYLEIEQNQNTAADGGYALAEYNRLLNFLFADADVANRLGAWKPVGDYVLSALKSADTNGYATFLNDRADSFDDECWRDSTFVAMRYFAIMVHEGMRQGVESHMWLFYVQYFAEELAKIYDATGKNIDPDAEFPTRCARLLYEAFQVMGNWIRAISHLDDASFHAGLVGKGEISAVIPEDAAIAVSNAMVAVALSPGIGDTFAGYLHDCLMHDISSMSKDGLQGKMRGIFVTTLAAGGNRTPGVQYGNKLKTYLAMTDHVLRGNVQDYVEAVKATHP